MTKSENLQGHSTHPVYFLQCWAGTYPWDGFSLDNLVDSYQCRSPVPLSKNIPGQVVDWTCGSLNAPIWAFTDRSLFL